MYILHPPPYGAPSGGGGGYYPGWKKYYFHNELFINLIYFSEISFNSSYEKQIFNHKIT